MALLPTLYGTVKGVYDIEDNDILNPKKYYKAMVVLDVTSASYNVAEKGEQRVMFPKKYPFDRVVELCPVGREISLWAFQLKSEGPNLWEGEAI